MNNKSFMPIWGPEWHYTTTNGSTNFIGAVKQFFLPINSRWERNTQITYYNDYIDYIFPLINPNISILEYDEHFIEELLLKIQHTYDFKYSTIESTYRHLIYDPCEKYFTNIQNESNHFWGAAFKFSDEIKNRNKIKLIPKSLSIHSNRKAVNLLFSDSTTNGEIIGISLMYGCGGRENEICGANFGDIKEMRHYPGCYYIIIGYETTSIGSNILKVGGKTWNAPRILVLHPEVSSFLLKRKMFVENQIGTNADNLPIACRGNHYDIRCGSNDLAKAGKTFLRDTLKIDEQDYAAIAYEYSLKIVNGEDIAENNPTTYLFRRNLATILYIMNFTITECQYYMGHLIEDKFIRRNDFNDENMLYKQYTKMLNHPYFDNSIK